MEDTRYKASLDLIVRKDPEGCMAILCDDEPGYYLLKGMQAELLNLISISSQPVGIKQLFEKMNEIYEIDQATLQGDIKFSLNKMVTLKLIVTV